jgi:ABC-type transport system substrate-binding protein/DNA-binding SARP family transcriptional activator/DNA-binding beta-propeller fold protein YncE
VADIDSDTHTDASTGAQPGLRFFVLGPLQVLRDGTPINVGGAQQRAVLALLLTKRERAVSVEQIAEALWGERPPAGHAATIQSYVFRLREVLEPDRHSGEHPGVLVTEPGGYRLHTDSGTLDMIEFEHLLQSGESSVAQGRPAEGSADLARALALWRGSVLADLADYDFVAELSRRLDEQRLQAAESRIDAELALGHHASMIAELNSLAAAHPLREHLQAQRMLALYRAGRQADALDAYRQVRAHMLGELGIGPGAELTVLHQSILNQEPGLLLEHAASAHRPNTEHPEEQTARSSMRTMARPLVAIAVIGVVIIFAGAVVYTVRSSPPSGLSALPANSMVRIDADGSFHDAVRVGVSPDGVALAGAAAWVANTSANTVSKIDLEKHLITQTTPVGNAPQAMAVTDSDLWVANSEAASVSRVSLKTGLDVDTVPVGIQPGAIAAGESGVWVANTGDGTVIRIDPDSGVAAAPIAVGLRPDGIAVDAHTVWVSNSGDATVSPIDVKSHVVGTSIRVGAGPAGIAATDDAVWVANSLSQSTTRIDPRTRRVEHEIAVGDGPQSITMVGNRPWVSNEFDGTVTVIDPDKNRAVRQIPTGSSVRGLVSDGTSAYATTRSITGAGHTGGTLHIRTGFMPNDSGIDPRSADTSFLFTAYSLVYDGLVGLRRTGGGAGLTLVPDLAEDLPEPSADGRTYVFTLRRGIRYSNGTEVKARDIKRGLQQELTLTEEKERLANIIGAPACIRAKTVCDLSKGVEVDDANYRIAIHLQTPDPDFLYRLTEPLFATPVGQPGVLATTPRPATGPYMIGEYKNADRFTLVRNPYFHPWSVAAQPEGYPDTIEWTLDHDTARAVHDVLAGRADVAQGASSAPDYRTLLHAHPDNFQSDFDAWIYSLFLNVHAAPFDDPDVRKAINFAIDRNAIVELVGGTSSAAPSCQILPTTLPGYRKYCPFTTNPSPDGSYHGPDFARAAALVARSGTRGMSVAVVNPFGKEPPYEAIAEYVVGVLDRLGYKARVGPETRGEYFSGANPAQLGIELWAADYPQPSNFFAELRCRSDHPGRYCNPAADKLFTHALATQRTDQVNADKLWAKLDQMLTSDAARLTLYDQRAATVVSDRVGNYQFNPKYGPLFGQMWVR